jgi:hypothetical protein
MGSAGTAPGKSIRAMTEGRELLDAFNPNWHTEADTVIANFLFDPRMPRHFHVMPGAHASTPVWVRMAYVAAPLLIPNTGTVGAGLYAESGSNTTTISVHDEHIDDLVNYTCARAYMKDDEFSANSSAAEKFAALFTGSINAKAVAIMGYNPMLTRLPFAPSPMGAAS